MKRPMLVFAAAGLLALPGTAAAQQNGSRAWVDGAYQSTDCPQPKRMATRITEDEARDLVQQYTDKHLPGFKVERSPYYGGGYETMCYQTTSAGAYQILRSVEYSIDATTPAGDRRNFTVDQFGNVTPFSPIDVAGARGPAGPIGLQGPAGPVGPQGMAGAIEKWASFKDFLFDTDKANLRSNEMSKVTEIAAYMRQNSSARVGIDGHADARGTGPYNQDLSQRRVNAIRDALEEAGVPNDRIRTGAFGKRRLLCNASTETCWQSNRRVEVLFGMENASR